MVGTWLVAGSSEWVMGSPYPDSARRLRLVSGWVEHNNLFPAASRGGEGFVMKIGTLLGPEKTAASSGARVLWSPP